MFPMIAEPTWSEMFHKEVMHVGSIILSGTFFWTAITTLSSPRTATAVNCVCFTAFMAYSTWYNRPSGEKMVMCLS